MSTAIRLNQSKNVGYKIEIMKWSNRMDVLAISTDKGEVIVQRLNFQKIWTHSPPVDGAKVRGIDWRPDEKIIAVGYSTGLVILLDIENQHEINQIQLDGDITCLGWTQNSREISGISSSDFDQSLDSHETFLPPLPSFNSLSSSSTAPKTDYNTCGDAYAKKIPNILIVGLSTGVVHTSVFGVLPCGRVDVGAAMDHLSPFEIVDAKMSTDFSQMYVCLLSGGQLRLAVFENQQFPVYLGPLLNLATKHGHILCTMTYIEEIIQCIREAWEKALLDMDIKLTKYAKAQPPGTVSADFLELLMMGFPSEPLEEFLTLDLTEKGLKKLGTSIEISYSTIQKLVIKPLHSGILNICYHLNCIKGMSKNTYYYKPLLGSAVNDASQKAGAFLIKSLELQQTIEQSTRDYKIFWCWLYGVIIRLMDETVPDDIAAVSQQDIIYLAEFLNTFDGDDSNEPIDISVTPTTEQSRKKRFNLERVGQYLDDKNLQITSGYNLTQKWAQLLDENECLKECEHFYPHDKQLSLVQQHNVLKQSISDFFSRPETLMGNNFIPKMFIDCGETISDAGSSISPHVSHWNIESEGVSLFAILLASEQILYVVELNGADSSVNQLRAVRLEFQEKRFFDEKYAPFGELKFCDLQFYNGNHLSMLLAAEYQSKAVNCFVQFPLAVVRNRMTTLASAANGGSFAQLITVNMFDVLDAQIIRLLDGTADNQRISVSGSRKVAALLAESKSRIRLYETEVEEEDDDLDMSQNASVDVSKESNISN